MTQHGEPSRRTRVAARLQPAVALVVLALLIAAGTALGAADRLRDALAWVERLGWTGVGVFTLLYVLACVLFLPGSILTLGAGAVFGVVKGSIIVSVASTLGATASFLVGRHLVRDWISSRMEGNARFRAIDDAIGRAGWRIVGLTRLSPVFPFNLLNYAFGLTRVSLGHYVLASWVGMMPGTVLYVYLGSLAGDLATLAGTGGSASRTPAEWAFYVVGLAATVGVAVVATRIARRALAEATADGPHHPDRG